MESPGVSRDLRLPGQLVEVHMLGDDSADIVIGDSLFLTVVWFLLPSWEAFFIFVCALVASDRSRRTDDSLV